MAIVLIGVLIYSAIQRIRTASQNRELFWANVIVPLTLISSLPPIYYFLDSLFGSFNLVNLIAHIAIVFAGWFVSTALGKMGCAYRREDFRTPWFSPVWLCLICLVTIIAFVQINMGHSDRGLDSESRNPFYGIYHAVTYLGFVWGLPHVAPRLQGLIVAAHTVRSKVEFSLFYTGYFTAAAALILQLVTPWASELQGVREFFIYTTGFCVTLAFVLITLDKKTLSQPQVQTGKHYTAQRA